MPSNESLAAVGTRREPTPFGERLVNAGTRTVPCKPQAPWAQAALAEMTHHVTTNILPIPGERP